MAPDGTLCFCRNLPFYSVIIVAPRSSAVSLEEEDYVFRTREGTTINYRNLAQRGLTKAADRAGLNTERQPKLTLHDLRHTFGSHLVRKATLP